MFPHILPNWLPATLLLSTTLNLVLATTPPLLKPRQASLLTCNQDNQLRALERFSTQASTFCPTYLATTTANAALPTYVADFQSADVSSACSCFQASATNTAVVLTLSATRAPTASASAPSKPTSTPSSHPNGGLSTGAKAGIGIACAVAGVAILLGGAMLFRRRRRRNGTSRSKHLGVSRLRDESRGGAGPPAYDAVEKDAGGYNHEVEAGNRFELQGGKMGGAG